VHKDVKQESEVVYEVGAVYDQAPVVVREAVYEIRVV
jgi:hypothetical protein